MKASYFKKTAIALLITIMVLAGCEDDPVKVTAVKAGEATIDWGDGSAVQTVTLSPLTEQTGLIEGDDPDNIWRIPHTYTPDTDPRTVIVTGNVTGMVMSPVASFSLPAEKCGSLESLDVSRMPDLQVLYCRYGSLSALDVSNNTALTSLWCDLNQLTSLDVTKNTALTNLWRMRNKFDVDGLNVLFGTLPDNASIKTIHVSNNPGTATYDQWLDGE